MRIIHTLIIYRKQDTAHFVLKHYYYVPVLAPGYLLYLQNRQLKQTIQCEQIRFLNFIKLSIASSQIIKPVKFLSSSCQQ